MRYFSLRESEGVSSFLQSPIAASRTIWVRDLLSLVSEVFMLVGLFKVQFEELHAVLVV